MITSKKLSRFKEIFHGFTTKEEGDFKRAIALFCRERGILVILEQVHKDKIKLIGEKENLEKIQIYEEVDGLVSGRKNVFLGIRTADCLPVLFYEPGAKIVGAVHAGWRGTLLRISQKMVREMEHLGGEAKNIVAVIGPHIGMCCYEINENRAKLFEKKFGQDLKMISFFEGKPHLDLAYLNLLQLLKSGVKRENIDSPPSCTSCDKDLFFSYRRSKKEGEEYGEMLAYIGLI